MDKRNIICSKQMKERLKKQNESIGLLNGDKDKIWPNFYEEKGFVLFGERVYLNDDDVSRIIQANYDKAGFEASYSEFRIGDYFKVKNSDEALSIAFLIADMWECKLRYMFPTYAFRIVISCDDEDVNVRYYRHRENEMELLGSNKVEDSDGMIAVVYID